MSDIIKNSDDRQNACSCGGAEGTGGKKIDIVPVGLDKTLLKEDYLSYDRSSLKEKYGFSPGDRVILFVGRMTAGETAGKDD